MTAARDVRRWAGGALLAVLAFLIRLIHAPP